MHQAGKADVGGIFLNHLHTRTAGLCLTRMGIVHAHGQHPLIVEGFEILADQEFETIKNDIDEKATTDAQGNATIEVGLPEVLPLDLHPLRKALLELREPAVDVAGEDERVRVGLLLDAQDHGGTRPVGGGPALRLGLDADLAELADGERRAAFASDDGRGEVLRRPGARETPHEVLLPAVDVEAGGRAVARGPQRRGHLVDADAVEREEGRVEDDGEALDVAADRDDLRDPRDGEEVPPHDRLGEPAQLHRGDGLAREREEGDLAHDRADGAELRPPGLGRKLDGLEPLGDDLPGAVDLLAPLELDPDDGDADRGGRAHAADARGAVHGRGGRLAVPVQWSFTGCSVMQGRP